jgi:hypothetical protein
MNLSQLLPLMLLIGLVGCVSEMKGQSATAPPEAPQRKAFATISVQEAQRLAPDEAKAIIIARAAVEEAAAKTGGEMPQIMGIGASRNGNGWVVHVQYVGGWFEGRPTGMAGFFADVLINEKWEVTRIGGGA